MWHLLTTRMIVVVMTAAFATMAHAGEWTGTIVTANEHDNSLSFISWPQKSETRIAVPIAPHNVQASADGKLVLAVGAKSGATGHGAHGAGGQLVVIDTAALGASPVITVPLAGHPAHVVIDQASKFAYVTNSESNSINIVDVAGRSVAGTIQVGRYPHGLRISPDGREIYVANMRDESVSVVDVAALREAARIRVGKVPVQVGFTPDGKTAFVSLNGENAVAIIDTVTRKVLTKRAAGRGPVQVHSSGDGTAIYVANQGSSKRPDNRMSVVSVSGAAKPVFVLTGPGAHGVSVSGDGSLITVTNTYAGTLSVIDAGSSSVLANIPVGTAPNGLTMFPTISK